MSDQKCNCYIIEEPELLSFCNAALSHGCDESIIKYTSDRVRSRKISEQGEAEKPADNIRSLQLLFSIWNSTKKPNSERQHGALNFIHWIEQQQASAQ